MTDPTPDFLERNDVEPQKLRLREDAAVPGPPTVGDAPWATSPASAAISVTTESRETRECVAGWVERFLVIVIAFAVFKAFQAILAAGVASAPGSLHALVAAARQFFASLPARFALFTEARPVPAVLGVLTNLERFGIGLILLALTGRLMLRVRILDAAYVRSARWVERTSAGLVLQSCGLLLQVLLLAWMASLAKTADASDGLIGIVLVAFLFAGAAWFLFLHLIAHGEYPDLLNRAITGVVFGLAIALVVLWPGLTVLWSRAGAMIVLALAECFTTLYFSAATALERKQHEAWWRSPLFMGGSFVILLVVAALLAIIR